MKLLFEQLGGTYHWEGDYLIPDLPLPEADEQPIGIWGQRHGNWLKQKHRALYHNLMFTRKLHDYLAEVGERAERMFSQLTEEMGKYTNSIGRKRNGAGKDPAPRLIRKVQ